MSPPPGDEPSTLAPAARAFLDEEALPLPSALTPAEGQALVDHLLTHHDAARLQRLAEAPKLDKQLAKAARKALHLLRTRGVQAPPSGKREFRVHGPYAEEALPALASMIDGRGERVVWLTLPAPDGVGVHVHQAELSETRGLIAYQVAQVPRRDWRLHVAQVTGDRALPCAAVPPAHVRRLIEEGYQRAVALHRALPDDFVAARLELGAVPPPGPHPAWELAPPHEDLRDSLLHAPLAALHELPEITTWAPPEEAIEALDRALAEIAESKLVVDPAGRLAQVAGAVDRLASETYDDTAGEAAREALAARLDETALVVAARDPEAARLCTTEAARLRGAVERAAEDPFVRRLFDKLVDPRRLGAA